MKKITIFGIVGAALLVIGSLALFILLVSYDANFTAIEYFSYLLSWTFDIILIVFFCILNKKFNNMEDMNSILGINNESQESKQIPSSNLDE